MPFSHIPKNPGDLIKSEDWNKALNAVVELFGKFDKAAGHQHSGQGEDAPPITETGIAANAISTAKIQNGSITAAKAAPGAFSRDIGIAVMPSVGNGQTIPPPSGFTAAECIFFATAKFINSNGSATWGYNVTVDATGKVTIGATNVSVIAAGLAMAKKGGWQTLNP